MSKYTTETRVREIVREMMNPKPQKPSGAAPTPTLGDNTEVKKEHKIYKDVYESVSDFMVDVTRPLHKTNPNIRRSSRREDDDNEWTWGVNYEEAVSMQRNGWPEGVKKIKEAAEKISKLLPPIDHRAKTFPTYSGGAVVDIARYCSGDPEHFVSFTPSDVIKSKVIKVCIEISAVGYTTAEQFCNRGACYVAMIDRLEEMGYRVELWACIQSFASEKASEHRTEVLVKKPNQNLELDKAAYIFSHPAFFRRLWFSYAETFSKAFCDEQCYGDGCGRSYYCRIEDADVYLFGYNNTEDYTTIDDAAEYIIKEMDEQGYLEKELQNV